MKKFWATLCIFAMVLIMSAGFPVTAFAYSEEELLDCINFSSFGSRPPPPLQIYLR